MIVNEYALWYLKTSNSLIDYAEFFHRKEDAMKKLKKIVDASLFLNKMLDREEELDIDSSVILLKLEKYLHRMYQLFTTHISNDKYIEAYTKKNKSKDLYEEAD